MMYFLFPHQTAFGRLEKKQQQQDTVSMILFFDVVIQNLRVCV